MRKKEDIRVKLLKERIEDLEMELAGYAPETEEYHQMVGDLKVLNDILDGKSKKLDPNQILTTGGTLVLGAAILLAEIFGHSITTKAWSPAFLKIKN